MSLAVPDYNSVDLTEDEDSGEGDCFVNNLAPAFVNTSIPPPLTPIQKLKSFQDNVLPLGHIARIPQLKKIYKKDQSPIYMKPPETGSTPFNVNSPMEVVYIESDSDESLVQNHIKPKSSFLSDTNSNASPIVENQFASMKRPPGKLVVIKKNNKLYKIVIPHNVMPNINQSTGPVLINIPEVGPLVITIDPNVKNQPNQSNELKPFSLNFDEIYENASMRSNFQDIKPKVPRKHTSKSKSKVNKAVVKNKYCWMPLLASVSESKGFTRLEVNAAKACAGTINLYIKRKCIVLERHIKLYEKFQREALKKNNIKPVKLTKILGNQKFPNDEKTLQIMTHNKKRSNTQLDTSNSQPSCFDDLLLTKKVVILNNGSTEEEEEIISTPLKRSKRKKNKHYSNLTQTKTTCKKSTNIEMEFPNIKQCFVKMTRNTKIDLMSLKYSKNPHSHNLLNRNASRVKKEQLKGVNDLNGNYKANESKYFKDISFGLLQKLIDTPDKLFKEMYFMKPTLVLNESNFKLVQYKEEFSKSNIVFPVSEDRGFTKAVLTHFDFILAVHSGHIKLVDSDLLCEFLVGDLVPRKLHKTR